MLRYYMLRTGVGHYLLRVAKALFEFSELFQVTQYLVQAHSDDRRGPV